MLSEWKTTAHFQKKFVTKLLPNFFFLFSTVNDFKEKYEFLLAEIRSLGNNSQLGAEETMKCYNIIQKKYAYLADSFTGLLRLASLADFERDSLDITINIQQLLAALRNYTVSI